MEKAEGRNQTPIMEFIILGFGIGSELQPLLFLVFLVIYIVIVAGNLLIIALVVSDHNLHTPMYFFLGCLSFLEICYTSVFLPRLLDGLLTGERTVSVQGCIMQLYFFGGLSTTETFLLTAMSYDRYLAICHPLRYAALMNGRVCGHMVAASWIGGFLVVTLANSFLWQLTFCGSREIDHFFCDFSPMIKLSCDDTRTVELVTTIVAAIGALVPCLLTLTSYVCIITSILRIPSSTGRQKAFSTCSSHLMVLTVFYVGVITVYVVPTASTSKALHKILSVFYIVLTPLMNPVIYSLRNKELRESLRKAVQKLVAYGNGHREFRDTF
ncbi:olfactory receptor 6F1-like [Pelodiscus sinensis]|uniref:olfactory receptor 6F1-like n=1 Tax=Pelodiscus sinensis TaxID=13735 RepID=UPI003F6D6ED2